MTGGALAAGALTFAFSRSHAPGQSRAVPEFSQASVPSSESLDSLVLAGGCFWGMQGVFQHVVGVESVLAGYAGGDRQTAVYPVVETGRTAHAEAVHITFDSRKISQAQLLQVFFSAAHDPTQINRQGPDHGPQYRSAVFPRNDEQVRVALAYIAQLDRAQIFERAIATSVEIGKEFFPAEAYHQDFMNRHPTNPYVVAHEWPKLVALSRHFPALYRPQPVLVGSTRRSG